MGVTKSRSSTKNFYTLVNNFFNALMCERSEINNGDKEMNDALQK